MNLTDHFLGAFFTAGIFAACCVHGASLGSITNNENLDTLPVGKNENRIDLVQSEIQKYAGKSDDSIEEHVSLDQSIEDRAWWTPKRIPEYLRPNTTNSSIIEDSNKGKDNGISNPAKVEQIAFPSSTHIPNKLIQFTQYQLPEPRDPNAIRFPGTVPLNKNKAKPRFDNLVKNHLYR